MKLAEIRKLVAGTSDPAFAIDGDSRVVAWNRGAEELFGVSGEDALGRICGEMLQGTDLCGPVCSSNCTVQQAIRHHSPVGNFDLHVMTSQGKQWCNVSVLIAGENGLPIPYAIHIIRPDDIRKRLELMLRDFVIAGTNISPDQAVALLSTNRAPAQAAVLTEREQGVLKLMANGISTAEMAKQLSISRTTVNNHIQHIMQKLDAHSRLEAIRRAEHAGLL